MHSHDSQQDGTVGASSQAKPVLKQTAAGWTIQMEDAHGASVLNVAVFPTKFLAEEALARILKRQDTQ